MQPVLEYIDKNRGKFVTDLVDLLKYPSVSADSNFKEDVQRCAEFVKARFETAGLKAQIFPIKGHPIVFAEYNNPANKRTLLIYGHYDVQPVDPLHLWKNPPFEPHIDGETIYARGATDDKGQFLIHLLAAESYLKAGKELPVNLKFLIEGEEEIASNNLEHFIKEHHELLKADGVIVSDTAMYGRGIPAITYGLRGIAAAEIKVVGPDKDLHSGSFGGSIANPVVELARIVAKLHDDNKHVLIDGFYDKVREVEGWEREMFTSLKYEESEHLRKTGSPSTVGEKGYSTLERVWARPTCEINGIYGGYAGEGSKTIVPSWAGCKVTMRLVPDQTPEDILAKFEKYVHKIAPATVKVEVKKLGGAKPAIVARDNFMVKACVDALEKGFGRKPVFIREGGSIPIVNTFKEELGLDTLLLGFGQQDDNAHSPNEKFSLEDFHQGIVTVAHLFGLLGHGSRA
ncbi:MAG: dipeptidase [candidate division Zixibacteria bacterium]|nr:dipeptidase [candidate division Zixibacteria bacterium]